MEENNRQQSIGLEILRPADSTLWKQALKSKPGRRTGERKLMFSRHGRAGFLAIILDRLKRPR